MWRPWRTTEVPVGADPDPTANEFPRATSKHCGNLSWGPASVLIHISRPMRISKRRAGIGACLKSLRPAFGLPTLSRSAPRTRPKFKPGHCDFQIRPLGSKQVHREPSARFSGGAAGAGGSAAGPSSSSGGTSGGTTLSNGATINGTGGAPGTNASNAKSQGTTGNNLGPAGTPGYSNTLNNAVGNLGNTNTGITTPRGIRPIDTVIESVMTHSRMPAFRQNCSPREIVKRAN
jgi:hypothetical protein